MSSYLDSGKIKQLLYICFVILTIWWLILNATGLKIASQNYLFGAVYGVIALMGGVWGIRISRDWGGFNSYFGKTILAFSMGLLMQELGQLVYSYYNIYLHIEVPYPSLADFGFFGAIPFYILGGLFLGRSTNIKINSRSISSRMQIVAVPFFMLLITYFLFLKNYDYEGSTILRLILDFGYPLGQAIYVSIAVLLYILSQRSLGGKMKRGTLLLMIALIVQFTADFNFLLQSSHETWLNAGYGDYIYLLAYMTMSLSILEIGSVYHEIRNRR